MQLRLRSRAAIVAALVGLTTIAGTTVIAQLPTTPLPTTSSTVPPIGRSEGFAPSPADIPPVTSLPSTSIPTTGGETGGIPSTVPTASAADPAVGSATIPPPTIRPTMSPPAESSAEAAQPSTLVPSTTPSTLPSTLPTTVPSTLPPNNTLPTTSAGAGLSATIPSTIPQNSPSAPSLAPPTPLPSTVPPTSPPSARSIPSTTAAATATRGDARAAVRVTKGAGALPNDAGQVWREYDITPYTSRAGDAPKPEQAMVDWVLRETGTETWFSQPFGVLSADSRTLRVYHTPEVQATVHDVVARFVAPVVESQHLAIRLMTLNSPGWRSRAVTRLQPIEVKSAGIDGWLMPKEEAALLLGELRNRADYKEQGAATVPVTPGKTETLARTRPRVYPRTVRMRPDLWPGFEMLTGQIDEGFTLQLSPLASVDGATMDLAVKCSIDQVERLVPVAFDAPIAGTTQRGEIQVPQLVSWRLNERLRWPKDQVLLLSCGVVAAPGPEGSRAFSFLRPLDGSSRADALLMVEVKEGSAATLTAVPPPTSAQATSGLPIMPLNMSQRESIGSGGSTAARPSPRPWRF